MASRSLITRAIASLFNGISQQPATLRLPSQAEGQVNMLSSVVDGIGKRPGTQLVANVTTDDWSSAHMHSINRDVGNRYQVVCSDGAIQVFDIADGTEKTVNTPGWSDWQASTVYVLGDVVEPLTPNGMLQRCTTAGTSGGSEPAWGTVHLQVTNDNTATWTAVTDSRFAADPTNDFALVTVADYTFIVNKTSYTYLKTLPLAADPIGPFQFVPEIWSYPYVPEDFFNALGDATLDGWVQTFSDLPASPVLDDYYLVKGFNEDQFGGYYVRYTSDNVWVETYGEGSNDAIDELTMPMVLVDQLDGTFNYQPFTWLPRRFGDTSTNPKPTFIGRRLNDVFFYKNRLGLLSDENVVFSGAGDFGNFFRNTVTTLLASDVVDVAVSTAKVSKLEYAIPYNNSLMLFSDQTQFALNVDEILTPTSVSIDVVTSYEMDRVDPLRLNSEVYFITRNGNFSRVREYYVDGDSNNTLAADITAHCPKYLPSDIKQLAGSGNDDILIALATGDQDNILYVYKYNWQGDTKVQSSWSTWEFSTRNVILSINVIENTLYMLMKRDDATYLEKIDLESGAVAGSLTHDVLLDRRTLIETADMSYNVGNDRTTITLPYDVSLQADKDEFYVVYADRLNKEGMLVQSPLIHNWTSANTFELFNGDFTTFDMFVGVNYDSEYEFTQLFNATREGVAITTGRTQVRTMTVYYSDANFFQTSVDPYGKNSPSEEDVHPQYLSSSVSKTLGDAGLFLGKPFFAEGAYQFSIGGNSRDITIKLKNNFPYQAKFTSAEWEALYFNRSR